jgi:hypothetical protein
LVRVGVLLVLVLLLLACLVPLAGPINAPRPAPTAIPRKGTKNSSMPNSVPHSIPQVAPPPTGWWLVTVRILPCLFRTIAAIASGWMTSSSESRSVPVAHQGTADAWRSLRSRKANPRTSRLPSTRRHPAVIDRQRGSVSTASSAASMS